MKRQQIIDKCLVAFLIVVLLATVAMPSEWMESATDWLVGRLPVQ